MRILIPRRNAQRFEKPFPSIGRPDRLVQPAEHLRERVWWSLWLLLGLTKEVGPEVLHQATLLRHKSHQGHRRNFPAGEIDGVFIGLPLLCTCEYKRIGVQIRGVPLDERLE